jgi:hypothetical protein
MENSLTFLVAAMPRREIRPIYPQISCQAEGILSAKAPRLQGSKRFDP